MIAVVVVAVVEDREVLCCCCVVVVVELFICMSSGGRITISGKCAGPVEYVYTSNQISHSLCTPA